MNEREQRTSTDRRNFAHDLNPDQGRSLNDGSYTVSADPRHQTAADDKALVNLYQDQFSMAELREIPIVPPGTPLKEGAVYLDMLARHNGALIAHEGAMATTTQSLTPKKEVPYEIWNRLIGKRES